MQNVRIVELPAARAAVSGPLTDMERFTAFNNWFSAYHSKLKCELCPRDFMRINERLNVREWMYLLPAGAPEECGGFEVVDIPSGLYAVASCLDADLDGAADWLRTRKELHDWVEKSELFELDECANEGSERYPMFHIVSPGYLMEKGISIEDMYVPVKLLG